MKELLKKLVIKILIWEARIALVRYKPFVIGITGSVGKTSTKDAMYALMKPHLRVRKSQKSFNSEFGIPLTILGLPNAWNDHMLWLWNLFVGLKRALFTRRYPKYLVLEIGADKPGDIKDMAMWLRPEVAVITRFPETPVHVEFFQSKEQVIEEKSTLAHSVRKGGMLILNRDDDKVFALSKNAIAKGISVVTFGENKESDIALSSYTYIYGESNGIIKPAGISANIVIDKTNYTFQLNGTVNKNHLLAFLPGFAFMRSKGFSFDEVKEGIKTFISPPGRMTILDGINQSTILDDSYNASPVAVLSAIETMQALEIPNRKIIVLGDMMELGKFTEEEHRKIGSQAIRTADILITIGIRSKFTHEEALNARAEEKECIHVDTTEKAIEMLTKIIQPGDLILFKGSQSSRLEKVIMEVLKDKTIAKDVLVRQDEEWQKR